MTSLILRGTGRPTVYMTSKGRVPSVTTIESARKQGGGLFNWYYQNGYDDGKAGLVPDPKRRLQEAADAGSLAHAMVENTIHGRDPLEGVAEMPESVIAQAKQGYSGFVAWAKGMAVEYVATETPLVSELYQYGGTPDAVGRVTGELAILDWKSSNSTWGSYVIQLAAYRHLWEENHEGDVIGPCYLLRFGKEHGDFHFHCYPPSVLELGWTAFKLLREMYTLDKELAKVCK